MQVIAALMQPPCLDCPWWTAVPGDDDGITDGVVSWVQVQGRKKAISEFSGFIQDGDAEVSS